MFIKCGLAAAGAGPVGLGAWAEMARHPLVGTTLPKWEKGHFRISTLYNGRAETAFHVFPDGTSLLIDCGDYTFGGRDVTPHMPDDSRRVGEWTARYILRENPFGRKVDYFLLTHYHSDHAGRPAFGARKSASGKYWRSGIGEAMDFLDFGTFIDRSWPDMSDPEPRGDGFDDGTVGHMRLVYEEALRRGAKVERFRLEKGSDQIRLLHGGCKSFGFKPLCARGCILRRDGSVCDLGRLAEPKGTRAKLGENPLSIGMVLSLGDFRYFTAGDFSGRVKKADGTWAEIEDVLAPECPQVDVAKANHHGHHSMPVALVNALKARVVLAGVWHAQHMNRPTMRRLAQASWPCLYAPGMFPKLRREADAAEPWMKDVAKEAFEGVHTVVDVAPDGASYRLMMVSAADESARIVGAYDFKTSVKKNV